LNEQDSTMLRYKKQAAKPIEHQQDTRTNPGRSPGFAGCQQSLGSALVN